MQAGKNDDRFSRFQVLCASHEKARRVYKQGCGVGVEVVESESEGILGGVGVGKNVPTPTPTLV
jgi:hypothetical protein